MDAFLECGIYECNELLLFTGMWLNSEGKTVRDIIHQYGSRNYYQSTGLSCGKGYLRMRSGRLKWTMDDACESASDFDTWCVDDESRMYA